MIHTLGGGHVRSPDAGGTVRRPRTTEHYTRKHDTEEKTVNERWSSPDKMLLGRLFSYPDTHRYRIGPNYLQLPINAPKSPVRSYNTDGPMAYRSAPDPVYAPNSFGGPEARERYADPSWSTAGEIVRAAYSKHRDDDNFVQPRSLYRHVLDDRARERLVSNIVGHLSAGVHGEVLRLALDYWRNVDADLGAEVAKSGNWDV